MLGAAVGDAGGGPDHEGDGVTEHERDLGRLIGDLVHGPESKVDEIQVDDGVHPGHRRSDPGGHHRRLRYGGVEDPARPDHLRQALDLGPMPSPVYKICANNEYVGVGGHLFGHGRGEPGRVGHLSRHWRCSHPGALHNRSAAFAPRRSPRQRTRSVGMLTVTSRRSRSWLTSTPIVRRCAAMLSIVDDRYGGG